MSEKQSFSTKANRHDFTVDGVDYYMPGITYSDFEDSIRVFEVEDPDGRIRAFREFMRNRVKSDKFQWGRKAARNVTNRLSPGQLQELFTAWSHLGKNSGEASGSQVSTSNIDDK